MKSARETMDLLMAESWLTHGTLLQILDKMAFNKAIDEYWIIRIYGETGIKLKYAEEGIYERADKRRIEE